MSGENLEIVRRLTAFYNERAQVEDEGYSDLVDALDRGFVWDMSRVENPEASSYAGLPGLREFVAAWSEGFASDHVEIEEILDAGERVVAVVRHTGTGRASGITVEQQYAMVWTLHGGRATRMDMYPTRADALKAVGLAE
jgi:ketosteroid isomerase-like protein